MTSPQARIALVVLRSRNLERLKDFYQSFLQTTFERHTDHEAAHYGASLGDVYLELYLTTSSLKPLDSIGFRVENLDTTIAHIDKQYVHRPPAPSPFGRSAMLRDPDNRLVHLTEVQHRETHQARD